MALWSVGSVLLQQLKSGLISFELYRRHRREGVKLQRQQMHQYQRDAYAFVMAHPFCALFIDMGLGKTVILLTVIVDLLMNNTAKKVLIIAPRRVANKTWPDEIGRWSHTCMHDYQVISGTVDQRIRQSRSAAQIHIISRDNIEWLVMHHKSRWPYDTVVIDESSSFKDHTTRRFKALRNVRRYVKRLVELTATPVAEGYMGLFAQIYLLDEGTRFSQSITHYQDTYFKYNHYKHKHTLLPGAREQITEKISDLCLVMRAEEYLDMLPLIPIKRPVPLTLAQSKKYLDLQETLFIAVINEWLEEVQIEAETAAALSQKLLQLCSGVVYHSYLEGINAITGKPIRHRDVYELHDAKLDELEQIVTETEGENLLVAYHFKSSLDRLKKRFPYAVVMDSEGEAVTAWNKGKIKMLLAHPQSAGHGLNLQDGGHIITFYDIPWSLETYQQFIGRLHRQGQLKPVMVIHLIAQGVKRDKRTGALVPMDTLDGGVVEALAAKEDAQEWLLNELTKIRRRVADRQRRAA